MLIVISPDDLMEEYKSPYLANCIKSLHIDCATNAIHGWYQGEEIIIFKFRDLGWINDNRYCSYEISSGPAGILIQITRNPAV